MQTQTRVQVRLDYRRPSMWGARFIVWVCFVAAVAALSACRRERSVSAVDCEGDAEQRASRPHLEPQPVRPMGRAHAPLPICDAGGGAPLSAARTWFDAGHYLHALSCASQAIAFEPDLPEAHAERAASLAALERFDEARLAYARLFALAPDHVDGLLGAAHLYAVLLPGEREHDALAAAYAERGLGLSPEGSPTRARFAVVSAIAHNDLGMPQQALARAELALAVLPEDPEALHERALSRFELTQLEGAALDFARLVEDPVARASAHYHLGLILERTAGKELQAKAFIERARALSPVHFPPPVELSPEAFREAVSRAIAELPSDMRRDLEGVPVAVEELPSDEDLLGGEPALSPMILGLYRGPPLGEPCDAQQVGPCRSVALYRRNLLRSTRSLDELLRQIRVTLLHEVGHLRGEDDHELAARGLD